MDSDSGARDRVRELFDKLMVGLYPEVAQHVAELEAAIRERDYVLPLVIRRQRDQSVQVRCIWRSPADVPCMWARELSIADATRPNGLVIDMAVRHVLDQHDEGQW